MKNIAIIGLGYVGLPLAVEFSQIRPVLGFDIDQQRIQELRCGQDLTLELSPEQLKRATHLRYSSNPDDLKACQIFIVTVPTPVDKVKRPDMTQLVKASKTVGKVLKVGDIVVYESTVYPGATEEVCVPVLEKFSGLKFNQEFFCGYSPERINPGDKVNTLSTIKKITSGSTSAVADEVDTLYRSIIKAGTWKASSLKVAEAAKVIENSQRDLNIAFVNELAIIFELIGIDTYYLTHKAEELGYHPQVILAGRRINDNMARYAAQEIIKRMLQNGIHVKGSTVGVMGITFKENCPDIRNSKVPDLVKELQDWGASVVVADPWAEPEDVQNEYGITMGAIDADHKVDALVVAVGHQEYREMTAQKLRALCKSDKPILADIKSLYNRHEVAEEGFIVYRF